MVTTSRESCPECDGRLRVEDGETVCSTCGLVVAEDRLDTGPEWRSFEREARERTGAPLTRARHDRGLSTEIGRSNRRVTGRKRRRLARLRRHHVRSRTPSKSARNRMIGFMEVRQTVSSLSLPESTRDEACVLFERAQETGLLRGRSIEGFAAAAVYAACRIARLSRTQYEVVEAASADLGELRAAYDAMNRELGLPTGPIDPREYLPRFADRLDLPLEIETRAREHVEELCDRDALCGRNPGGVAAACLYAAAVDLDHELTQSEAAAVADVTPVTLRGTYVKLRD